MVVKNKEVKIIIKSKKELKSEFLVIEEGDIVQVKILTPLIMGKMKNKSCYKVTVLDYNDNKNKTLIVSAVLKNILMDNYSDDGFVNKSFEITKGEKVKGTENTYNSFDVSEIEVE